MAHKYMSYSMDSSGLVTRNHQTLIIEDISQYNMRERMMGWPERYVFWKFMADGSRNGIAPMTDTVFEKMIHYTAIDGAK